MWKLPQCLPAGVAISVKKKNTGKTGNFRWAGQELVWALLAHSNYRSRPVIIELRLNFFFSFLLYCTLTKIFRWGVAIFIIIIVLYSKICKTCGFQIEFCLTLVRKRKIVVYALVIDNVRWHWVHLKLLLKDVEMIFFVIFVSENRYVLDERIIFFICWPIFILSKTLLRLFRHLTTVIWILLEFKLVVVKTNLGRSTSYVLVQPWIVFGLVIVDLSAKERG